jgi:hypothetical protein
MAAKRFSVFGLFGFLWFGLARATTPPHHHDSDWLIFLSGEGVGRTGLPRRGEHQYDGIGRADVLLTHNSHRLRILAETVLSTEEVDVERLQVGIETSEDTLLWLGRFHQPASAWNTEHHHGQYLQTAITRPSIELWEDEGGLIPQHLVGGLLETQRVLGESAGLRFSLGVGAGSVLTQDGFEPLHIFKTNQSGHKLSWAARLAWFPDFVGATSAGLLLGSHKINVVDAGLTAAYGTQQIDEREFGAYVDWNADPWRVIGTAYYVNLDFDRSNVRRKERFGAGYIQTERQLPRNITLFARHENSSKAGDSLFVAVQRDNFNLRRTAVGVRWDFAHRQALTVETARTRTLAARFNEYRLQWSAVVP